MKERTFADLESDFEFLDDWEERYKYVIELGKELPDFDEALKCDEYKVNGCVSQVWIRSQMNGDGNTRRMSFTGDSDALIVRGLIAIVRTLLSGRPPQEILGIDAREHLGRLGLHEHLTPQRSNGLMAMVTRIKADAAQAIE